MKARKSLASDNNAGVHPAVLQSLTQANDGYAKAYGDDPWTEAAIAKFRAEFGSATEVFFVFNGTGANVLGLQAATRPFHAIITPATAHINTDEGGAPERHTGCKLLTVPCADGKLRPEQIVPFLHALGNQHHNQPSVVSITQATEVGTVYTPAELRALADVAHRNGLVLHMDGARLANAAAGLGVSLAEITVGAGVDILSFGGTKNGLMFGEAVLFFNPVLAEGFEHLRKQGMQLASKMRYIATQFTALLTNKLWLENAGHANRMAIRLATELARIPGIRIVQPVEANGVFAVIPPQYIPAIQEQWYFYVWDETTSIVRLMCSYDLTESDVLDFVSVVKRVMGV